MLGSQHVLLALSGREVQRLLDSLEARVAAQGIEPRIDLQKDDAAVLHAHCDVQPAQRFVRFASLRVDLCDLVGAGVALGLEPRQCILRFRHFLALPISDCKACFPKILKRFDGALGNRLARLAERDVGPAGNVLSRADTRI